MLMPFVAGLKPNSITLAGSELARNRFGASSELVRSWFGGSSEPASVMEFGTNQLRTCSEPAPN